ncbi:MAG: phosphoglucosamine mutase [Clostridiales bacterium]|nr:phosphoglucosamine mutase [Clostridiales bacterium]
MKRLFGTDGVRGVANSELTPELAFKLGKAGATVLTSEIHKPKILIGRDTRISGNMLEAALIAGMMSVGADVLIAGVIPTPAVAYLTRYYHADAGVMISASHNSVEFNGIKFFDSKGFKLPDQVEDEIQRIMDTDEMPCPIGTDIGRRISIKSAKDDYMEFLASTIDVSLEGIEVVMDCANGAASGVAPQLFKKLGATVYPYYFLPDGTDINKNCGSTHPERICEIVKEIGADIGLAFDGDADRLIACDERGVELDGDHVLAICGRMLMDEGKLNKNTIVGTVMSNMGLDIFANKNNIHLEKTTVGDRYVLESMLENGYSLGGEKSGHVIFLEHNTTGDGILTALQLLRAKVMQKKEMSVLAKDMKNLPQVLVNIKVDNEKKNLYKTDESILNEIKKADQALEGRGRTLIRASGTEPLIRVMLEGDNVEEIDGFALNIAKAIEKACDGKIV